MADESGADTMTTPRVIIRPEIPAMRAITCPTEPAWSSSTRWRTLTACPDVALRLGERLAGVALNRYPGRCGRRSLAAIERAMGVPPAGEVLLGNGSDELIQIMLSMACAKPGAVVARAANRPSSCTSCRAAIARAAIRRRAARRGFHARHRRTLAGHRGARPALVFLAYPNNPTGNLFYDDADIERGSSPPTPGLVVIDEAYQPFADELSCRGSRSFPTSW